MVLILIGPAGAGKSTVGQVLAADLDWPLLDSEDREEVHHAVARALERRESLVAATSGLTAQARQTVRGDRHPRFIYLKAPRTVLEHRLERSVRATPIDLHAQLLAFEDPGDAAVTIDASQDVSAVVARIKREVGL